MRQVTLRDRNITKAETRIYKTLFLSRYIKQLQEMRSKNIKDIYMPQVRKWKGKLSNCSLKELLRKEYQIEDIGLEAR